MLRKDELSPPKVPNCFQVTEAQEICSADGITSLIKPLVSGSKSDHDSEVPLYNVEAPTNCRKCYARTTVNMQFIITQDLDKRETSRVLSVMCCPVFSVVCRSTSLV